MKPTRRNFLTAALAAFATAILPRRAAAAQEGWIPIDQELPPMGEKVLLTVKDGQCDRPCLITMGCRRSWSPEEARWIERHDGPLPEHSWCWSCPWGKTEVLAWRRDVQPYQA